MNADFRLRSISVAILSMLCVGAALACSGGGGGNGGNGNAVGAGGNLLGNETYGSKGGSTGTGASASTGTGATGTNTGTGSTGTGASTGAGASSVIGTQPGTENSHNCLLPNVVDQQDALITDFKDASCAGLCYGSGGGVVGTMSAPSYECGGTLSVAPDVNGMVITGTISGPTTFHLSFAPCAYVHGYNSIQSLIVNRVADLNVAVAMNTMDTSPPSKGGTCSGSCADPAKVKIVPGRAGGSENVITWAFDQMSGAEPPITYFRNQVVGLDLTLAPATCGTATTVDLTIKHMYFYNAPI